MGYTADICTGGTATCSIHYDGATYDAPRAFDDNTGTYADVYPCSWPDWIKYDLGSGVTKTARRYTYQRYASGGYFTAWKFQGSNNNTDWTDIDTQSGISFSAGEKKTFDFANSTAYRYYRWLASAGSTNDIAIAEMEIMEYTTEDVTLTDVPALTGALALAADIEVVLAGLPALTGALALDVGTIYNGYFIPAEPLTGALALDADLGIVLAGLPALTAQGALTTSLVTAAMIAPPLTAQGVLDISGIFYGIVVPAEPLTGALALDANLGIVLAGLPELTAAGAISAATLFGLYPGALTGAAALAADAAIFVDTDYQVTYLCVLTGASDGLADVTIPMSSFQGRFRSGNPSFLSCVIPGLDYADAIAARPNGDIEVWMVKTYGSGYVIRERLAVVDLDDIRIDEGSSSQSITLSGHRTETYSVHAITLEGASYRNVYQGKTRYRCRPNLYLRPGDTVTVNGETFTADTISWIMAVGSESMEVAEA